MEAFFEGCDLLGTLVQVLEESGFTKGCDVLQLRERAIEQAAAMLPPITHQLPQEYSKGTQRGSPVTDPFVIAVARGRGGYVVTEEAMRENAAKIPNVCDHFVVPWLDAEGFKEAEGWSF